MARQAARAKGRHRGAYQDEATSADHERHPKAVANPGSAPLVRPTRATSRPRRRRSACGSPRARESWRARGRRQEGHLTREPRETCAVLARVLLRVRPPPCSRAGALVNWLRVGFVPDESAPAGARRRRPSQAAPTRFGSTRSSISTSLTSGIRRSIANENPSAPGTRARAPPRPRPRCLQPEPNANPCAVGDAVRKEWQATAACMRPMFPGQSGTMVAGSSRRARVPRAQGASIRNASASPRRRELKGPAERWKASAPDRGIGRFSTSSPLGRAAGPRRKGALASSGDHRGIGREARRRSAPDPHAEHDRKRWDGPVRQSARRRGRTTRAIAPPRHRTAGGRRPFRRRWPTFPAAGACGGSGR